MGASSSSEGAHLNKEKKRVYRKPTDRAKTRFDAAESTSLNTPYEASIDKFDYLIVFPLTTGPYVHPTKKDETDTEDTSRIGWREIRDLWYTAVPGSETKKNKAIAELARVWKQRTGSEPSDDDTMRTTAWLTIARETIVDQLMNKCGLQIKLSANASHIFCRVRAPIKLLELQTDKDNYRLQLRGEVDPGSEEFWNVEIKGEPVELEEEKRLYTVDEARIILEKLYRAGKIAASELTINTDVETQSSFSRRVHTLERIADKVPVTNNYVAYSDFLTTKPHLRYLYQTYASVRGTTLFRSKDRILLTKRIMDANIDISVLEAQKVVTSFFALHDANRGEKLTVESLSRTWTTFWMASAMDVGAPTVTHPAYDEGEALWFFLRPFAQPIAQIREYFGEKVAIYFAWLGFYTYYLVIPALLGIAIEVVFYVRGYQDTQSHIDWPLIGYGILMLTWAIFFDQSWMAECKMIALKWGTRGFESEEKDRPQFKGETSEIRSPITNRKEPYFSDTTRNLLIFGSGLAIVVLIAIDVVIFIAILYMQNEFLVTDPDVFDTRDMYFLVSFLIAVEIQLMSMLFTPVIEWLNQAENHRTETDYEDHLVVKFLGFETFNSFGACVFTAFLKEKVFDSCYNGSCVKDLRMLIYAIIVVRLAKKALQVTWLSVKGYFRRVWNEAGKYSVNSKKDDMQTLLVDSEDETEFMAEINREKYHGTFNDFAEAYMQFSYITLFFVVVPILPIIALVENLVKIRVDAYTLCALTRRPHVEQCEDAGYWSENLTMMIYLGVFMSVALFIFTEADFTDYDADSQLITFFAASMALMVYAYFLQFLITSEPDTIDEIAKRQEFIVNKFVKDFEDDDENLDIEALRGNVEDTIDVDGLNLYDLRKGLEISDADFTLMEELERQRRELLRELKMNKERLQDVYKTEHFNENSGVGETKHGLPLGRVSVKLVEIQNLRIEDLDLPPKDAETYKNRPLPVMLRVSFVGTKAGAPAPAPQFGKLTDTERLILDRNGVVPINQALGPFAPIRTVDARVQFDVLFLADKSDPLSVASTSIELRDLSDQAQQNKILPLRIRSKDGTEKVLQLQDQKASARLYVNLTFQYSKVVPIRNAVYIIQDKLQTIERELSRLKAGKKREY